MTSIIGKYFLVGCMFSAMASHAEQDNRSPKDKYLGGTQFAGLMCPMEFKLAQAGAQGDLGKCVADSKTSIKKSYDAYSKLVKKQAAKNALKEHYIAVISGLQGISPQPSEIKLDYERRQTDSKVKIDEAWVRFETEY